MLLSGAPRAEPSRLAWLSRIPRAVTAGRINRNWQMELPFHLSCTQRSLRSGFTSIVCRIEEVTDLSGFLRPRSHVRTLGWSRSFSLHRPCRYDRKIYLRCNQARLMSCTDKYHIFRIRHGKREPMLTRSFSPIFGNSSWGG